MEETVLLKNLPQNVENYQKQWDNLRLKNPGLNKLLDVISSSPGQALIFSHDDPDGITSGLIFKRLLAKKGWKVNLKMPPGFVLTVEQFNDAIKQFPDLKAIFILDKGTLESYSDFAKKVPIYIVDHHPTPKPPTGCTIFNPSLETYTWCSTSILAHGIATLAGVREKFDDFLCLIGLKGDWAIEPVKGVLADFAKPFFIEYGIVFKNLFFLSSERPTMFDAEQREKTCLLSRISEFVHGTGGGGFQYFYNDRHESLKDVDHPQLIAIALESLAERMQEIDKVTSLNDFVNLFSQKDREILTRIYGYFLEDWENASRLLDSSVKVATLGKTGVYLFVGGKVPLLPMIGSIKLFDLKQKGKDEMAMIIMVSMASPDCTHISVRGTGDQIHSGKFCSRLEKVLHQNYPEYKHLISGGGHPKAAENITRTGKVPFINIVLHVVSQLSEMININEKASSGDKNITAKAKELGLEYIN